VIVGLGQATIVLPMGTQLVIDDALLYPDLTRTVLSYKDIRCNGFHIETHNDNKDEYLFITKNDGYAKQLLEKIPSLSTGLYFTYIKHVAYKIFFQNLYVFKTWHDRLGHPRIGMMRKIIGNSIGHHINTSKLPKPSDFVGIAYAMGKLILRPSYLKIKFEALIFLEHVQGDICGPIHPLTGPFRYLMILIDASTRWSHVCLLSTKNHAFTRFIAQIIKLRAHYPNNPIKPSGWIMLLSFLESLQ
jgi:hypothetical protein